MAHSDDDTKSKISREFMARLNRLGSKEQVHAIIMLRAVRDRSVSRQSRDERRAAIEAIRSEAEAKLPEIDRILERFDGKRLTDGVSALGSIRVEANAAALTALASSDHVKAILEDQAISALL